MTDSSKVEGKRVELEVREYLRNHPTELEVGS